MENKDQNIEEKIISESIYDYFESEEEQIDVKRKYLIVVIYDVVDNKRRNKLSKYLNRFGFRVQKSAFECILEKSNYEKLLLGIGKFIGKQDLLRIYKLSGNADVQTWGTIGKLEQDDVIII